MQVPEWEAHALRVPLPPNVVPSAAGFAPNRDYIVVGTHESAIVALRPKYRAPCSAHSEAGEARAAGGDDDDGGGGGATGTAAADA